jgi:beta-lactamase regulating signal transducer with metallopeptidase domain
MNLTTDFLQWLAEATLRGSACIVAVWLLRPLFRTWLGARAMHLLWIAVLVALLSPWLPRSPLVTVRAPMPAVAEVRGLANARVRVSVQDGSGVSSPSGQSVVASAESPLSLLFWIWAGGAGAAGALALFQTIRATRLVRRAPEVEEKERIASALAGLPHVPATLRIRETDELRSPALCGVFQPTILLPAGWQIQLNDEELRCVLLHEIGHLHRGDLLWRWAFLLARAVHWFNPLVWLAARSARADQEMACDEWVCSRSISCDPVFYGEVLLKTVQLSSAHGFTAPAHVTMAESKIGLTRRVRHLAHIRFHGARALATACAATALVLLLLGPGPEQVRAQAKAGAENPPAPERQVSLTTLPVAPVALGADPRQVEIAAVFIEVSGSVAEVDAALGELFKGSPGSSGPSVQAILTEAEHKDFLQRLNSTKHTDTDMLAAPRVTTRVGQRAVIEIIREFRYPTAFNAEQPVPTPKDFETRNVGVTVEALPERISGNQLRLVLIPQVVEFLGFVNYNGGKLASGAPPGDALSALLSEPLVSTAGVINQPIFARRKITTAIPIKSGQTALLFGIDSSSEEVVQEKGLLERLGAPNLGAPPAGKTPKVVKRSLFMLVTPRIVDPTAAPRQRSHCHQRQLPFNRRTQTLANSPPAQRSRTNQASSRVRMRLKPVTSTCAAFPAAWK